MRAIFVDIKYCVNLIFKFCEMTKRIAEISMHQKVAEYPNTLQIKSNEILNKLSEGENRLRNLFNQFSFALNWFKNCVNLMVAIKIMIYLSDLPKNM